MKAVWLVARSELRRRWRAVLVLTLVAGLGAGFAVTAGVGARRAATAWDRMRDATRSPHAIYSVPLDADPALAARISRLPEVEVTGSFTYIPISPEPLQPGMDGGAFIALDPDFGVNVYRPRILQGRHADPRRADEVTINEAMAKRIRVGQRVNLLSGFPPDVTTIDKATVVGIHRGEFDLGVNSANAQMLLGHSFLEKHDDELRDRELLGPDPAYVARLRGGDEAAGRFQRSLRSIYGADAFVAPGGSADSVTQAIDVQRVAWTLLAAAAGLAALVAAGQALSRVAGATTADAAALRALGMRRPQLAAIGAVVGMIVAFGAAIVAVAVGILASPLVPSGLAYRVDPDRGIYLEPAVLAAGAAAVIAVLVAAGGLAAWRAAGAARREGRSRVRLPGRGPVPVVLGSQWALGPSGGPAAASARSALVAVAAGLAGVIAVVTFASSHDRLQASPDLYGWAFDGGLDDAGGDGGGLPALKAALPRLAADRDVTGLAWGSIITILVEGQPVEAYELEQAKGLVVHPTLLEGRVPAGAGEIALATGTLRDVDKRVGDSVAVAGPRGPQRMIIVGRAAYPEMGNNGDIAHMASLTRAGGARIRKEPANSFAIVRVGAGANPTEVLERHRPSEGADLIEPFAPPKVHNLGQAGSVPWVLAGFLALLGLAAVGHALVMSVRARRGEIAVLRTIGLVRRQVGLSVAAQATTTVILGSLLGVPLGIALGRWTWSLVANGVGVVDDPKVAIVVVLACIPAAIVIANVLAAGPAAVAARLRPAQILRSE